MEQVQEANEYQILVAGVLDSSWSEWLDGLAIQEGEGDHQPVSLLGGKIRDQAHLRGILGKIWDLNLKVLSVSLIKPAGDAQDKERSVR
jgi:hypothetical protein